MANEARTIAVPTTVGSAGAGTDCTDLEAELRTFQYEGTAGDEVEIQVSSDGTNWFPKFSLYGPEAVLKVDDRALQYRAKRVSGTAAATLTVTGKEQPTLDGAELYVLTVGHADLTAAATSQSLDIEISVPANTIILGVDIALSTPFSGGGASAVSVDIGVPVSDPDCLVDGANLFAAAVNGKASTHPLGIAPNFFYASSGRLAALFISDVNVADLTAGACVIRVLGMTLV